MDIKTARTAIEAILAAIPDNELPTFDRVEVAGDGSVTVWWGGQGRVLGSAKTNGKRRPIQYREHGSWDAIQSEMTYRADRRFLENGDKPDGITLAKKSEAV